MERVSNEGPVMRKQFCSFWKVRNGVIHALARRQEGRELEEGED